MRKRFLKIECLVLAMLVLLTTLVMPVQAGAVPLPTDEASGDGGIVQGGNDQLRLYVNGANGHFAVVPAGEDFTEDALKSYAAVSIGGAEYTYGGSYPDAGTHFSGVLVQEDALVTQWLIFDYAIQQHMRVVQDEANHNAWAAHIWYDILYVGEEPGDIALRLLLDTRFGADDAAGVVVGEEAITTGRHFAEAPEYFYVPETADGPKAFGALAGDAGAVAPASLSFLNYGQAAAGQLFATQADEAQLLAPDSAALFDFPARAFEGGAVDEADCRITYSVQYGYYGIGVEDGVIELDPEDLGLEVPDPEAPGASTEAASYPIVEKGSNLTNLLVYPASAAPGETVQVTRVAQPEGILYLEEQPENPDTERRLMPRFADGTSMGVFPTVKQNEDGTMTYSFPMPSAAELDAHGGGVMLQFTASPAPGYYALIPQGPSIIGLDRDVQLFNDLPHSVAKPGATVTLAAASATTGKIYLDVVNILVWAGSNINYRRLEPTVLPESEMDLDEGLSDFVTFYSLTLPADAPEEGMPQEININAARGPVLADFAFPDGTNMAVKDFGMLRDGTDGMYWFYRAEPAGIENWDVDALWDYTVGQNVTLNLGDIYVGDLGLYEVAVYDGEGNELPSFYGESFSKVLYDPTGTIGASTTGAYTLTTTRPTLDDLYPNGILYEGTMQLYVAPLSPGTTTKLTDVHVVVSENLPTFYDITVVDGSGAPLDSGSYTLTTTKAAAGEQVQFSVLDTSMYVINGVTFTPAVAGPGGTDAEVLKNRVYDFVMPAAALEIEVDRQAPPVPKARYTITPHFVVNQQSEKIYDYSMMDQTGAVITSQLAGEKVYLSAVSSTSDPGSLGLQSEPFRVFNKAVVGQALSDDVPVYSAAGEASAPTEAEWYFVMPEQDVGVTLRTTRIETRKNIAITETTETFVGGDGKTYGYEIDGTHAFSTTNGSYAPQVNPGSEVRVVVPQQVNARQMREGQWLGSERALHGANVSVQDAGGNGIAVRLVPAAEMNYSAEAYYEYAFTMPDSDVAVDVLWKLGKAAELTVDAPSLPSGVAAPTVRTMLINSRTEAGTSLYDVEVEWPECDYAFTINANTLPVGVVNLVAQGEGMIGNNIRFIKYGMEIAQNTTVTLAMQQLAPYPTITSSVQTTPYFVLMPRLDLTGHGISATTNEAAAFDYRITYTTREERAPAAASPSASPQSSFEPGLAGAAAAPSQTAPAANTGSVPAQSVPVTAESVVYTLARAEVQEDGSTVWSTAFFNTGVDVPYSEAVTGRLDISNKGKTLCHVSIEASRKGMNRWVPVYDTPIEFATEVTTVEGEYNFVSVTKEKSANSYRAYGAQSLHVLEKQLESLDAGTRLLDISSDAGFKYNESKKTFTLTTSGGETLVKIGDILTAKVPKGALFSVYENNGSVRVRMASSVKIATPKKDLLVPPNTGFNSKYFEINFKKGTGYATRYEQIYDTGGTPKIKPIQIEWDNEIVPSLLQLDQSISAKLSNIQIFEKNVVVGGSLNIALPVFGGEGSDIIRVDVEQVKYGYERYNFEMLGFKANGAAQIPDILGALPVEAGAVADIDTLGSPKYYHFELTLILMDIGFDGELTLIPGMWKKYPQWMLPDKFRATVHAPIPIVPGVLELSSLGGGFSNLADTINADYDNLEEMIPPFKLSVNGTLELLELLYGEMHAYLGASDFWFDVRAGATFMDIKDVLTSQFGYKLRFEKNSKVVNGKHRYSNDPNNVGAYHITLGGSALINFLPKTVILYGATDMGIDLWLDLSYEHLLPDDGQITFGEAFKEIVKQNMAFEFHMFGKLRFQIPEFHFLGEDYGPYVLFGIEGALTHQFVRASVTVVGIRVGFSYDWSKKKGGFIFELAEVDNALAASIPAYDDEGDVIGSVQFGENLTLLASSQQAAVAQGAATPKGGPAASPMAISAAAIQVQGKTHTISVPHDPKYDDDYSVVVQVGLAADQFTVLQLDTSSGEERWLPYALNGVLMEEAFAADESKSEAMNALMGKNATLIQLAPGEWKIMANDVFDSWVMDAKAAPQLTSLAYSAGQMQLQGAHMEAGTAYYVNYGLNRVRDDGTEQYIELDTIKVDAASIAGDGTMRVTIPIETTALAA
ncbi:MAG: hypothetical protein AB7V55_01830, partial [Oscillospiraceae bacterium]